MSKTFSKLRPIRYFKPRDYSTGRGLVIEFSDGVMVYYEDSWF